MSDNNKKLHNQSGQSKVITSTVTVNPTNKAAENKTVENQKTISQITSDLSNINHQAESVNKGDVPNPEINLRAKHPKMTN